MGHIRKAMALFEKLKDSKIPGFYESLNGSICCMINAKLITIFINVEDNSVDITIDKCSSNGLFEQCVRWETAYDYEDAMEKIKQFTLLCLGGSHNERM